MTVYLDLVMGLNFVVDLLLLMGTNRLAGHPPDPGRAAMGAAVGGLYGGACLLPGFQFLGNLFWRSVTLGLMSLAAFGINTGTIRRGILFGLLSMALGGVVVSLGGDGVVTLIVAAAAVFVICSFGFLGNVGKKRFVNVRLAHAGRTQLLKALCDTGNHLRDPMTGESILVTGAEPARVLLGIERASLKDPVAAVASGICPGARLIPYRAVGRDSGFLLGFRFRDAWIDGRKGSVLVAFAEQGLGEGKEEFNALIGGIE